MKEVTGKIGNGPANQMHSFSRKQKSEKSCAEGLLKDERISSNRFANGSNMNCGNMITDKPTTRISAPPGGESQVFFG